MTNPDNPMAGLGPEDTDIDAFNSVALLALSSGDNDRVRALSNAVMAPMFLEHFIGEMQPGNQWNDMIYCYVKTFIGANRELEYLRASLDEKKSLVKRPDAAFTELVRIERHGDRSEIRPVD